MVANADLPYVYNDLLPDKAPAQRLAHKRFSCSVVSFFWGVDKIYPQIQPHTLFLANGDTDVLVVEMGTNHPGEIAGLCRTARPTGGVITNIGASHLEGLASIEGVAREKVELAASLPRDGVCVLNADCPWTPQLRSTTSARTAACATC